MTAILVASASGSPGVTTTGVLLAAECGRHAVVVEAAVTGGTLPGVGLHWTPGVVTLASSFPGPLTHAVLGEHAQLCGLGVPVLVGAPGGPEAAACMARLGEALAGWAPAPGSGEVLVVDAGVLGAGSVLWPLATGADLTVLVVRQWESSAGECAARVRHTNALAAALAAAGARLAAVVVGERPYSASEVAAAIGFPVAAVLPWDTAVPAVLAGGWPSRRPRGGLRRAAAGMAAVLLAQAEMSGVDDEAVVA